MVSRLRSLSCRVASTAPRRWMLAMAVTCILLIVFLVEADKPWNARTRKSIAKREAAGTMWKIDDYITVYCWYMAAGNLVLALGLLVTARWWGRPLGADETFQLFPQIRQRGRAQRLFWIGTGAAVFVGACYRVPRMTHSFWNDEEYSFRTYVWGEGVADADGKITFEPVPWQDTVFRNKSNNHILCSILARVSHTIWKPFAAKDGPPFREWVVRVLPLMAGLGCLFLLALMLARMGYPAAGVAAAFFLAFNPWHIRYSVEMRGYAYLLFFVVLGLLMLMRALREGAWKFWIAYAACEVAVLLSFPGALFEVAAQNGLAFALLFFRKPRPWGNIGRLAVANVFGAMVTLQVLAPFVPQISKYMAETDMQTKIEGGDWLRDWWSHVCEGIPWQTSDPALHEGSSVASEITVAPFSYWQTTVILPAILVIGLAFLFLKRRQAAFMVVALLGGAASAYVVATFSSGFFYNWYLIYCIVAIATAMVLGVEALSWMVSRGRLRARREMLAIVLLGLFIASYAFSTADARHRLVVFERQPIREAAAFVRGEAPAFGETGADVLSGSFGTSKGMLTSYDPRNVILKKPLDLEELIARARSEKRPLFVLLCGRLLAREDSNDGRILERVEGSGDFVEVAYLKGLEELYSYHIYRLKGGEAGARVPLR